MGQIEEVEIGYSNSDNNASCFSGGSLRNTVSMARSASVSTEASRGCPFERHPLLRRGGSTPARSRATISAFRLRPFSLASRVTNSRTSAGMRSPKGFISRVIALTPSAPVVRQALGLSLGRSTQSSMEAKEALPFSIISGYECNPISLFELRPTVSIWLHRVFTCFAPGHEALKTMKTRGSCSHSSFSATLTN